MAKCVLFGTKNREKKILHTPLLFFAHLPPSNIRLDLVVIISPNITINGRFGQNFPNLHPGVNMPASSSSWCLVSTFYLNIIAGEIGKQVQEARVCAQISRNCRVGRV